MEDKVKDIIASQLCVSTEEVTEDALLEDLGADELDIVDIVMSIEDEFYFSITDEEIAGARTVGDIIRAVQTKL